MENKYTLKHFVKRYSRKTSQNQTLKRMNKLCNFFKRKEKKICFYCNFSVISISTIGTDQKITYVLKTRTSLPLKSESKAASTLF